MRERFDDPSSSVVATELVTTSISSGGDGSDVRDDIATCWRRTPHIRYFSNRPRDRRRAVDATPFGHYQLQKLIGRGGMGEVWRAYDTRTDRIVALKVLPANLADDATFQQRFRRESQAAAGLNEPHVVPIHGFGARSTAGCIWTCG